MFRGELTVLGIVYREVFLLDLGDVKDELGLLVNPVLLALDHIFLVCDGTRVVFKDNVLQSEGGVKLVKILLVGLESGLLVLDLDTYLLVALDELPEDEALLEVLVLHNGVGAHYGGANVVSAKSLYDSGALVGGNDVVKLTYSVRKGELTGAGVVGVCRLGDLNAEGDLSVGGTALKLGVEIKGGGVLKVLGGEHMCVTL